MYSQILSGLVLFNLVCLLAFTVLCLKAPQLPESFDL